MSSKRTYDAIHAYFQNCIVIISHDAFSLFRILMLRISLRVQIVNLHMPKNEKKQVLLLHSSTRLQNRVFNFFQSHSFVHHHIRSGRVCCELMITIRQLSLAISFKTRLMDKLRSFVLKLQQEHQTSRLYL